MKAYEEYTRSEKEAIIKRGGDQRKQLEKALNAWLDTLDLDERVQSVVDSTDPIYELFGWCETKEDVIEEAMGIISEDEAPVKDDYIGDDFEAYLKDFNDRQTQIKNATTLEELADALNYMADSGVIL